MQAPDYLKEVRGRSANSISDGGKAGGVGVDVYKRQVTVLGNLLSLQERVRGAGLQELRFIATNETRNLVSYSQAVLWESKADVFDDVSVNPDTKGKKGSGFFVSSLSGVPEVDRNNSYVVFLNRLLKVVDFDGDKIQELTPDKVIDDEIRKEWAEWLPSCVVFVPLVTERGGSDGASGVLAGVMMLARNQGWSEGEISLLQRIAGIYSYELADRREKEQGRGFSLSRWMGGTRRRRFVALAVVAFLLFPFRISVLVPAEIVPLDPWLVRSPLDGVIKDIPVKPNQKVEKGQLLVIFDRAALEAQREVYKNSLKVAEKELRQVSQAAMSDVAARVRLGVLKGRVEEEKTNLAYTEELLSRAEVRAAADGVVVFEDVFDWVGRPVSMGERIMLLAQPDKTELKINLPVRDAIDLKEGADVRFFSNARPDVPLGAELVFHSYRAIKVPDGDMVAYKLKARWKGGEHAALKRLGLKGTAKVYGGRQPLIWQVLRRPFVAVRQFFGV